MGCRHLSASRPSPPPFMEPLQAHHAVTSLGPGMSQGNVANRDPQNTAAQLPSGWEACSLHPGSPGPQFQVAKNVLSSPEAAWAKLTARFALGLSGSEPVGFSTRASPGYTGSVQLPASPGAKELYLPSVKGDRSPKKIPATPFSPSPESKRPDALG